MDTFTLGLVVIVYLLLIAYLGYVGFKKTKTAKDYLLGGREIHPFVMAVSYGATFISTSAIIGFGGISGVYGMGLIWLTFLNIFVGVFIAFIFFGRRTRKMGHNLDAHTFPEFIGARFQSKSIQMLIGAIIFVAMPLYAAVVLIGGARFIESIFQIDFGIALTFFSVIIAAYVVAGGLKGVMYTDALQGGIMFVSLFFLLFMTYIKLGGVSGAHEALTNMANLVPESLHQQGHHGWTVFPSLGSAWWWILTTNIILGVGIGVLAQPQLVVRFMTVKSNRELNRAVLIGGIFIFVVTGFIYTVGSLSNLYFYRESGQLAIEVAKGNVDLIIPEFLNAAMPEWFVYLFMLSLLSAGMSTLSSQFHTMGTSIGRDLFENLFPQKNRNSMLITRIGIIFAILISIIIGYKLPVGIVARGTAIFFGVCAAAFLPAYFAGLYWKGATKSGVKWSIWIGLLVSVFMLVFMHQKESQPLGICQALFGKDMLFEQFPWAIIDPIVIALPVSALVLIGVSIFTPKMDSEHLDACHEGVR
ncbi:sodium:solute symporter family protein [Gaoshiqia sediminis]|uniref:Sodium:solute symporter family protein n=1 Tax=Gaoshiqia sediminis TaxID=2986998 RepID=A0AA42C5I7_9BACT|nr:sodium:solute symporter family protein [Gaoshiqia sediminis]MCW0482883.1 sodium:solute symporter family protein [Gaoshiqia sediminis]